MRKVQVAEKNQDKRGLLPAHDWLGTRKVNAMQIQPVNLILREVVRMY
jgi:hypothetical protein